MDIKGSFWGKYNAMILSVKGSLIIDLLHTSIQVKVSAEKICLVVFNYPNDILTRAQQEQKEQGSLILENSFLILLTGFVLETVEDLKTQPLATWRPVRMSVEVQTEQVEDGWENTFTAPKQRVTKIDTCKFIVPSFLCFRPFRWLILSHPVSELVYSPRLSCR